MPRAAIARARFGNAGTSALLADRQPLRTKLEVGAVSDPLEREADSTADQVVRMKAGADCSACARGDPCDGGAKVRRSSGGGGGPAMPLAPAAEASVRRGTSGGEPLPAPVRESMEPRFGADFSGVRVHRDAAAADSARGIGARAYTVGNHIAFGASQWAPGTDRGDRLIAHELTHTLQDGGSTATTVRGDFLDDLGAAAGAVVDAAGEAVGGAAGAVAGAASDAYDAVAEVVGQGIDGAAEVAGAVGEAVRDAVGGTAEAASDAAAELAREKLLGQVAGARARLAGVPSGALVPEGPQLAALNAQVASLGRVSSLAAAPAIPALGPLATLVGEFLAWLAAGIAALTLSEVLIILAIVAAIVLIILWFVDTSKTKPITIAPPITISPPITETPPEIDPEKDKKKDPKKDPKTDDPPPPPPDACAIQFGLLPFINARRLEQRGPINNETTVDRALFRLDAGIAPPAGQDTGAGSRAFARRIGCPPDDAGHVIAKRFGGQASFNSANGNIYPQDPAFNRGQMNQTDRVINDLHRSGRDVCSLIQLSYSPENSLRPTHATYFFMFRAPGQLVFSPLISSVQRNESTDPNCQA